MSCMDINDGFLYSVVCDLCAICLGLFALPVGVIGRLCSVIVALPGHIVYCQDKHGKELKCSNTEFIYGSKNVHYENMPIQIYRKFHLQKLKIFR